LRHAHVGSGILGSGGPADEWNGNGGCEQARFVRELHRLLGADDDGDDVAGRGAGGLETLSNAVDAAFCVGSSIGLMLMVVALGVMNVTRMSLIAALVLGLELLPEHRAGDLPVALAIVALGISITADL
jgi:Predicted metal-binding integral membrane protein (DUF2182)